MDIKEMRVAAELKELVMTGLNQVEIAQKIGKTPARVSQLLKKYGLTVMTWEERLIKRVEGMEIKSYDDLKDFNFNEKMFLKEHFGLHRNLFDETKDPAYIRVVSNRLYHRYIDMKNRCYNPNCNIYENYGAKGIGMCDEWLYGNEKYDGFDCFAMWALQNGYEDGLKKQLQIDRINNMMDYSPNNCRWVDPKTNSNNRTNSIRIEENGVYFSVTEYAVAKGLSEITVRMQLSKGKIESVKLYDELGNKVTAVKYQDPRCLRYFDTRTNKWMKKESMIRLYGLSEKQLANYQTKFVNNFWE